MLKEQIKYEEGLALKVYLCPAGKRTIGYGHNLDAKPYLEGNRIPEEITAEVAEVLLEHDIDECYELLTKSWTGFLLLEGARRDALVNMAFQMGIGKLSGFQRMHDALLRCDWNRAYKEAMDSTWAVQSNARAKRVANQFMTGEYYVPGPVHRYS